MRYRHRPGISSRSYSSLTTGVYTPKGFVPHAASLDQAFAHCPKFPTAASRRSRARVSVPLWPATLSGRLPVVGLVSHYLTNYLMGRRPIPQRSKRSFHPTAVAIGLYGALAGVSPSYSPLRGRLPTYYSPVRRWYPCGYPLDLHVLSTPPAFTLSQDQTLHKTCKKVLIPDFRICGTAIHISMTRGQNTLSLVQTPILFIYFLRPFIFCLLSYERPGIIVPPVNNHVKLRKS